MAVTGLLRNSEGVMVAQKHTRRVIYLLACEVGNEVVAVLFFEQIAQMHVVQVIAADSIT